MATSRLSICNLGLVQVPAEAIASVNEQSLEARECARVYDQSYKMLLEAHEWDFNIWRDALAALTNDRTAEWLYAYAVPVGMASPLRVIPNIAAVAGAYVPLAGQRLSPVWNPYGPNPYAIDFIIVGTTLYTNEPDAILEYSKGTVDEGRLTAMFVDAFALDISSRVVMPILKSRERQKELVSAAEIAKQRAIADDINRNPQRQWAGPSEAELARGG